MRKLTAIVRGWEDEEQAVDNVCIPSLLSDPSDENISTILLYISNLPTGGYVATKDIAEVRFMAGLSYHNRVSLLIRSGIKIPIMTEMRAACSKP